MGARRASPLAEISDFPDGRLHLDPDGVGHLERTQERRVGLDPPPGLDDLSGGLDADRAVHPLEVDVQFQRGPLPAQLQLPGQRGPDVVGVLAEKLPLLDRKSVV